MVTVADGSLRSGGNPQGVDRAQQEHGYLYCQGHIARGSRMVSTRLVKPEQERIEEVDRHYGNLKDEKESSNLKEQRAKATVVAQVKHHVARPQHHRGRHGHKVDSGVSVEYRREAGRFENAPQHVGHIVCEHAHQKTPVRTTSGCAYFGVAIPNHILVDDKQDDGREDSNNRIGHARLRRRQGMDKPILYPPQTRTNGTGT